MKVLRVQGQDNCWEKYRNCRFNANKRYECQGEKYDSYLEHLECIPELKIFRKVENIRILLYGTSFLREIWHQLACILDANDLIVNPKSGKVLTPFPGIDRIDLKSNSTVWAVVNHPKYQRGSENVLKLQDFIHKYNFTHALFMEAHPDCYFSKKVCVPTGNGKVQDRLPSQEDLRKRCLQLQLFAHLFDSKSWIHVAPWSGLFRLTNVNHALSQYSSQQHISNATPISPHHILPSQFRKYYHYQYYPSCSSLSSFSSKKKEVVSMNYRHSNPTPSLLFDTQPFIESLPCSADSQPQCGTLNGTVGGHQCYSGTITYIAYSAISTLLEDTTLTK